MLCLSRPIPFGVSIFSIRSGSQGLSTGPTPEHSQSLLFWLSAHPDQPQQPPRRTAMTRADSCGFEGRSRQQSQASPSWRGLSTPPECRKLCCFGYGPPRRQDSPCPEILCQVRPHDNGSWSPECGGPSSSGTPPPS